MEIKNFNIYNNHNGNPSLEGPKKKKLHKKTISALNSPHHYNHLSPTHAINHKISQKENLKHEKKHMIYHKSSNSTKEYCILPGHACSYIVGFTRGR